MRDYWHGSHPTECLAWHIRVCVKGSELVIHLSHRQNMRRHSCMSLSKGNDVRPNAHLREDLLRQINGTVTASQKHVEGAWPVMSPVHLLRIV